MNVVKQYLNVEIQQDNWSTAEVWWPILIWNPLPHWSVSPTSPHMEEYELMLWVTQEKYVAGGYNAQWESARPNLDLPKIEARSEVSA